MQRVLDELGSSPDGISDAQSRIRLQEFGPNVFPTAKKTNPVEKFLTQFKNLFNVVLLIASILSFFSGWVYNDPGSFQMGLAILGVVLVNSLFSVVQEFRAEKAVQAISKLVPTSAKVVRDGQLKQVSVASIVPGDIIALEEGDRVPADARLISAFETSVDNSILTGESEPQRRFATMTPSTTIESMTDYQSIVFAGSTIGCRAASSSRRPNRNLEYRSGWQAFGHAKHPSDAQPGGMV